MNRRRRPVQQTFIVTASATAVLMLSSVAAEAAEVAEPPADLNTVINNITKWLVGLAVSLATLFLTAAAVATATPRRCPRHASG